MQPTMPSCGSLDIRPNPQPMRWTAPMKTSSARTVASPSFVRP